MRGPPGSAERPAEVMIDSTRGTATLPMKPPGWKRPSEYFSVSMTKIAVPALVAPHDAYDCVDGMPNELQPDPGKFAEVWSKVHPGRGAPMAFLIGPSTRSVSAVMLSAGASIEK